MKKLWILPLVALYLHSSDESRVALVVEYKNMFSEIGKKRIGVDSIDVDHLKSPFVVEQKSGNTDSNITKHNSYVLQVIVNKRAKISGKWYGIGEMTGEMKVVSILKDEVTLKSDNKIKLLKMRKRSEKFSIK